MNKISVIPIYSVWDIKAKEYDVPFFARNNLFAGRRFIMDIRNRKETMISSFKDDFELHLIAEFDSETGTLTEHPRVIIKKGSEVDV